MQEHSEADTDPVARTSRFPSPREARAMLRLDARPIGTAARAARAHDIDELRLLARRAVPRPIFDFVDGGAGDERVVHRNRAAFDAVELVPRVLRDVRAIDLTTRLPSGVAAAPIVTAPIGLARAVHPLGEIGIARAAARFGVPSAVSTMTSLTPAQIARHAPDGDRWLQLYVWRDREATARVVRAGRDAGFSTLVVTLDVPVAGNRLRDARHGLAFPPNVPLRTAAHFAMKPAWTWRALTHAPIRYAFRGPTPAGFVAGTNAMLDPSVTFDDLARLRDLWPGPVLVKGVLSPDDARELVALGIDGIVVSNHGGRQLEQAMPTAVALPRIREAIGPEPLVLVDGGVRTGAHVAAALALGANAVLVGRAVLYGLMAGGQAGADRALELLIDGLDRTMALLGAPTLEHLTKGGVVGSPAAPGRTAAIDRTAATNRKDRTP